MARRHTLPGLALFLALFVLAAGSLQATQHPLAYGSGPAWSAGFGLADLQGALQWLLGVWTDAARPASSQRADLPKEGTGIDPNGGTPKPPPASQTNSTSAPPAGTSSSGSKHGSKH